MAFEPINIFSNRIDPRGVANLLRGKSDDVRVVGPDDDWSTIEITLRKGGMFRRACTLEFGHSAEYYDGEDWPRQVFGMRNYFAEFPDGVNKSEVLRLISTFRFSLSVPTELDIDGDDERLAVVFSVCQHLDGAIFTPSSLRDTAGRVLLSRHIDANPAALMPKIPVGAEAIEPADLDDDDYEDPDPPTVDRVARRAMVLAAISARALLEHDAEEVDDPESFRREIYEWVEGVGVLDELEPDEAKVLQRPVGTLDERAFLDSMWRVEGLAVLAWALQLHPLPPHDETVVPFELYETLGFRDVETARSIIATAQLRDADELEQMLGVLLGVHWRVRDYSINPQAMDFVSFAKDNWFGGFDIGQTRVIDDDLAIADQTINDASPENLQVASSIASERHLAINWLHGYSEIYSETDTST